MEIYLFAIALGLLTAIFISRKKANQAKEPSKYHFQKKEMIMTDAEARFFEKLIAVIGERFIIIPQAHLSTFVDHHIKGQNWKAAFRVINGKSVDFLLVEKASLKPVAAVELDDWSHTRPDRISRDEKIKNIFDEIGLLFVRFDNPDIDSQTIVDTFYHLVQDRKPVLSTQNDIEQK